MNRELFFTIAILLKYAVSGKSRAEKINYDMHIVYKTYSHLRAEEPNVLEMVKLLASTLWTSLLRMAAMERMRCCVRGSIRHSIFKDDSNSFSPFPET